MQTVEENHPELFNWSGEFPEAFGAYLHLIALFGDRGPVARNNFEDEDSPCVLWFGCNCFENETRCGSWGV